MTLTPEESLRYPAIAPVVKGLPPEKHFGAIIDEMIKIIRETKQSIKETNNRLKVKRLTRSIPNNT